MALTIGTQLGSHEITTLLGKGGMGEVYRARDLKLKREVAIKILPEEFSRDADRVGRFQREAEVLASLNHPNIAGIYELAEANGSRFLVLELVEGETLADRIARGPIPVEEALAIAKQICEALEAAHEKGIIHRDLKPANVKLTPDGNVKVLDFGLAKALEASPGAGTLANSPTMVSGTGGGVILGTAGYMSPEQARGRALDRRTDIWSFGIVLHEMLTGKRLFQGDDLTETIASIVKDQPDLAPVPPRLRRLVDSCLEKDPKKRLQSIGDWRLLVEGAAEPRSEETPTPAAAVVSRRKVQVWMAAAGILLAIAITLGLILMLAARAPTPETMRFAISLPEGTVLEAAYRISVSPDGRRIAFSARNTSGATSLWIRPIDSLIAQPLPGTQGAELTFWSPDSRWIGFFAQGKLKKIEASGGPPQTLCDAPAGRGGTWNSEGLIIFAPEMSGPLSRVSAAGGAPTPVTKLTATQRNHRYPAFLPDGKHFIYSAATSADTADTEVLVGNLESEDTSVLLSANSPALFSPAGYVLFARQGVLVAQQFDTKKFRLVGEAIPVAEQLNVRNGNFVSASVSASGTLVYIAAAADIADWQLTWLDRTGKVVDSIGPAGPYRGVELSPDGKRIAVHRHEGAGGDLWLVEAQGPISRFTFDPSQDNSNPLWSPDGKRIAFGSRRGGKWGIYEKPTDGMGKEELVLELGSNGAPMSWSTDGKFLAYFKDAPKTAQDIWALPMSGANASPAGRSNQEITGERKPFPVVEDQNTQTLPQISPDGKWIAYVSNESGRYELYVRPFPTGEGHWQITNAGALSDSVRWRGDSKELFYLAPGANAPMMAVAINAGTTFQWGTPSKLFDSFVGASGGNTPHSYHDFSVSRDGQRFLIPQANRGAGQTSATQQITVVLNWTAALNKK